MVLITLPLASRISIVTFSGSSARKYWIAALPIPRIARPGSKTVSVLLWTSGVSCRKGACDVLGFVDDAHTAEFRETGRRDVLPGLSVISSPR